MKEEVKDKSRLKHIIQALNEIEFYTKGIEKQEFLDNSMMRFACIKQLEIIGEASNHLSDKFKNKYARIEWRQIIGMRNVFVHEYFSLDNNVLWDIVSFDIPKLKKELIEII
ncbi:DUF86 domain-containing protein [Marivirga sp.]|uniref:HepT-like ribonuclease domain-containing protein n=1 Tax=Marivirga sp. TaxID=2018662 RepID=UPI0026011C67|nr:DUF86 domain-containing protein [Marivirga sp.]